MAHNTKTERNDAISALARSLPPLTLQEIADRFGITRERVRQILIKRKVAKPRGLGKNPDGTKSRAEIDAKKQRRIAREYDGMQKMAQALALRLRGYTFAKISKEMGFASYTSARKWVKRANAAGITITSVGTDA